MDISDTCIFPFDRQRLDQPIQEDSILLFKLMPRQPQPEHGRNAVRHAREVPEKP
jgi:hypothetical protein